MTLDTIGQFTWLWGHEFFVKTTEGNWIWSDPDYPHGDNTLRKTPLTLGEHLKKHDIPYGRDKGRHTIRDYCGEKVVIQ
ncbi:unnamed protein product [marine sediment metagenome]|uniref:Uncharacterized protein n=1 Tax=marine sediment metagenome TaxID=412755 RepID=X1PSX2_9ZZZZ